MTRDRERRRKLLEAPVGRTLVRLALPMMIGIAAVLFFNIVDTFWIGRLGPEPLAAIGFTFPVVMVVSNLTIGLGIGSTAVIARALGEERRDEVRRLTTDALGLALLLVATVSLIGFVSIEPLFRALGADERTLPMIREYMEVWYLGVGLLVIPMVGNGAIRATGDTVTPSLVMVAAGLVNAALDPLLIFGWGPVPSMGLRGAAFATVASYTVSMSVAFWILGKREKMLTVEAPRVADVVGSWRRILRIGLPAAGTNLLTPLAAGAVTRIVSSHGPDAVAAFGVGTRVEGLSMMGVFALTAAITPFVGQNLGAGRSERLRETLRFVVKASLVWGGGVALLLAAVAEPLARVFNDDPQVVERTALFFRIVPASYWAFGIALLVAACFNAADRPYKATALAALRLVVLAVPLAWLGSELHGLAGLFGGIALANVIMGFVAGFYGRHELRVLTEELEASGASDAEPTAEAAE
ncbi:MAG TPA: MATE family efflux transporter [Sandaracinaceae bacterium LLY-WYZ-13_1]|nr:MATE family efflux transporter [Sandaracinaceae bacterium LLY-WYZ-13_1]